MNRLANGAPFGPEPTGRGAVDRAPVVIAAGGTGGHVVPALAVADELAARDVPVIWLGTRAGIEARLVPAAGIDIRWIDVAGLRGKGPLGLATGPLRLVRAIVRCALLLRRLRPRAVLGMGGYVAGPVALAAVLLRLPLVLHEQNAVAGMTNRRLARFATRRLAAWPDAFGDGVRAEVVGNPVRGDIAALHLDAEKRSGDDGAAGGRCTGGGPAGAGSVAEVPAAPRRNVGRAVVAADPLALLVVGGSRGARALNETVPAAVAASGVPVAVRHQSGEADVQGVRARYAELPVGTTARVEPFIDDMAGAYGEADLVICRSGAMTVTELAALGLPSILVPFPHAVDDHQRLNGQRLSAVGAALLFPQHELDAERLAAEIRRLANDRDALAAMATAARRCFRAGAAGAVADALLGGGRDEASGAIANETPDKASDKATGEAPHGSAATRPLRRELAR